MNMEEKVYQIPIEDIIPNRFQPRLTFDDNALQELANSIKQHGIIQPLVLRKLGDKYEIIAGERRYKASQMAGLTTVPAVISNIDDDKSAEVALIENIQRKNLTSIEEAKSYKNLLDRGYMTQEQLAEKLGVSQSTIANKLRLLNLAEPVQDALLNEKISERHARSLLALKNNEEQIKWLNRILNDRLTVRQLDIELKKLNNNNDDDDDSSIPLVELTPNINDIKENALDINPSQGLHDIESMLKPSMPGEKVFDLSNPIDNIETLDLDDDIKLNANDSSKPQNKFFNFLEDEAANMNEDNSIDDIFLNQPNINNTTISNSIIENRDNNLENNINIEDNNNENIIENLNSGNNENELLNTTNTIIDNDLVNIEKNDNDNTIESLNNSNVIEKNENTNLEEIIVEDNNNNNNNTFFNFGFNNKSNNDNNIIEDSIIEENTINPIESNVIEMIQEPTNNDLFDPMSMVDTLEPDYQEKVEEAQGIDLKTAINEIRNTKDDLESKGFNITMEEADLGDTYNISINIIK